MAGIPTFGDVIEEAQDRLDRIYGMLGDVQNLLISDIWGRLTDAQIEELDRMGREIAAAKQAVENAKTRGKR